VSPAAVDSPSVHGSQVVRTPKSPPPQGYISIHPYPSLSSSPCPRHMCLSATVCPPFPYPHTLERLVRTCGTAECFDRVPKCSIYHLCSTRHAENPWPLRWYAKQMGPSTFSPLPFFSLLPLPPHLSPPSPSPSAPTSTLPTTRLPPLRVRFPIFPSVFASTIIDLPWLDRCLTTPPAVTSRLFSPPSPISTTFVPTAALITKEILQSASHA